MLKWVAILKSVMTKTAKSFDKKSLIAQLFLFTEIYRTVERNGETLKQIL